MIRLIPWSHTNEITYIHYHSPGDHCLVQHAFSNHSYSGFLLSVVSLLGSGRASRPGAATVWRNSTIGMVSRPLPTWIEKDMCWYIFTNTTQQNSIAQKAVCRYIVCMTTTVRTLNSYHSNSMIYICTSCRHFIQKTQIICQNALTNTHLESLKIEIVFHAALIILPLFVEVQQIEHCLGRQY